MFERNLFQSKFADFFQKTYGNSVWIAVRDKCSSDAQAKDTPDELNAK